jgi:hypothetical protein
MSHIYVSFSNRDRRAANALIKQLRAQNQRIWADQRLKRDNTWWDTARAAIRHAEAVVLLQSAGALESRRVQAELETARKYQRPVLPVLLSGDNWYGAPLLDLSVGDEATQTIALEGFQQRLSSEYPTNAPISALRFDGVYRQREEGYGTYLRFYPDGLVIYSSTTAKLPNLLKWFNQDNEIRGSYVIHKDRLWFSVSSEYGTVNYKGRITERWLMLHSHSHINGRYARDQRFTFLAAE